MGPPKAKRAKTLQNIPLLHNIRMEELGIETIDQGLSWRPCTQEKKSHEEIITAVAQVGQRKSEDACYLTIEMT